MELRHLRCFVAVAEELHFARAAERLHMEQSPLSRTIKDLEYRLGVQLFERTTRRTRLTWAGTVLLKEARRVIAVVEQAKASVKGAAAGYRGQLRVALSDGVPQLRLASLLALCRDEEPDVEICLHEVPSAAQVKGLQEDLFDVGFAQSAHHVAGLSAVPVWFDPLVVTLPARHQLLAYRSIPLEELTRHPLVLCDPNVCEGFWRQLKRILDPVAPRLTIAERVPTLDLMMALVAAGYGLGLTSLARMAELNNPNVMMRPLAGKDALLTTYLVRRNDEPSEQLQRFIDRVTGNEQAASGSQPNITASCGARS
ncbi:LysR family transcriptional regulator [Stutzerimonas stutzeri]|uniref:D-alanyl-D-alanine endopeptidase n=1 Tax=Stutzerimonas stutzeri TaxID=316 RepID=A0A172WKB0_STUST|nr:LysR substrate-binding domain-containing protein [Stutzerimonas stutzeri]ANF23789.1 D-alanyl-D-alanine endopeptidase [Stutzerimonas stutzeri]